MRLTASRVRAALRRSLPAIGLVVALAAAAGPPARADALDDALSVYRKAEYEQAFALLRPLAEAGNATAQLYLGLMFLNAKGVEENPAAAADWFRRGAAAKLPSAQKELADLLYQGKGVAKNFEEAGALYELSARAGHPEAQFMLGHMYHRGLGRPKDLQLAEYWYKTSADQGYVISEVLDGLK